MTTENYNEHWGFINYKGKVVLDIGADSGSTAAFFSERGAQKIICIEGMKESFDQLLENSRKIPGIQKCFLGAIQEPMAMKESLGEPADIVKIDIEGAEINLLGIDPKIIQSHDEYIIEVHNPYVYNNLKEYFERSNFKVESFNYDHIKSKIVSEESEHTLKILYAKKIVHMKQVYENHDKRGDFYKFEIDSKPVILIYTKAGFMRGGEFHNVTQINDLIIGSVELILRVGNEVMDRTYEASQEIVIPKNVPHYFIFRKDTLITEVYAGDETVEAVETKYDPDFRKIVEASFR
jgi:precorrin-6B methylase 2